MFSHYTNKKSAIIDLLNEMLQLYNYMCKSDKSNRLHDPMCCPNVSYPGRHHIPIHHGCC